MNQTAIGSLLWQPQQDCRGHRAFSQSNGSLCILGILTTEVFIFFPDFLPNLYLHLCPFPRLLLLSTFEVHVVEMSFTSFVFTVLTGLGGL